MYADADAIWKSYMFDLKKRHNEISTKRLPFI